MPKDRERQSRIKGGRSRPVRCVDGDLVCGQRQSQSVQVSLDATGPRWEVIADQQDPWHPSEGSRDVTSRSQLVPLSRSGSLQ
jgi:hypothetical protein